MIELIGCAYCKANTFVEMNPQNSFFKLGYKYN